MLYSKKGRHFIHWNCLQNPTFGELDPKMLGIWGDAQ